MWAILPLLAFSGIFAPVRAFALPSHPWNSVLCSVALSAGYRQTLVRPDATREAVRRFQDFQWQILGLPDFNEASVPVVHGSAESLDRRSKLALARRTKGIEQSFWHPERLSSGEGFKPLIQGFEVRGSRPIAALLNEMERLYRIRIEEYEGVLTQEKLIWCTMNYPLCHAAEFDLQLKIKDWAQLMGLSFASFLSVPGAPGRARAAQDPQWQGRMAEIRRLITAPESPRRWIYASKNLRVGRRFVDMHRAGHGEASLLSLGSLNQLLQDNLPLSARLSLNLLPFSEESRTALEQVWVYLDQVFYFDPSTQEPVFAFFIRTSTTAPQFPQSRETEEEEPDFVAVPGLVPALIPKGPQ